MYSFGLIEKLKYLLGAVFNVDRLNEYFGREKYGEVNVVTFFLLPIATLVAVISFLSTLIYAEELRFDIAVLSSLFYVINCFVAFLVYQKCSEIYVGRYVADVEKGDLNLMLFMLFFSVMFADAMLLIFPSMFFLSMFKLYTIYQAWHIADTQFDIEDGGKMRFAFGVPIIMLAVMKGVAVLMRVLFPNIM